MLKKRQRKKLKCNQNCLVKVKSLGFCLVGESDQNIFPDVAYIQAI